MGRKSKKVAAKQVKQPEGSAQIEAAKIVAAAQKDVAEITVRGTRRVAWISGLCGFVGVMFSGMVTWHIATRAPAADKVASADPAHTSGSWSTTVPSHKWGTTDSKTPAASGAPTYDTGTTSPEQAAKTDEDVSWNMGIPQGAQKRRDGSYQGGWDTGSGGNDPTSGDYPSDPKRSVEKGFGGHTVDDRGSVPSERGAAPAGRPQSSSGDTQLLAKSDEGYGDSYGYTYDYNYGGGYSNVPSKYNDGHIGSPRLKARSRAS